jgi:hypothetical protein
MRLECSAITTSQPPASDEVQQRVELRPRAVEAGDFRVDELAHHVRAELVGLAPAEPQLVVGRQRRLVAGGEAGVEGGAHVR